MNPGLSSCLKIKFKLKTVFFLEKSIFLFLGKLRTRGENVGQRFSLSAVIRVRSRQIRELHGRDDEQICRENGLHHPSHGLRQRKDRRNCY